MTDKIGAKCRYCGENLSPQHKGPCPKCGKEGKDIHVILTETVNILGKLNIQRARQYTKRNWHIVVLATIVTIGSSLATYFFNDFYVVLIGLIFSLLMLWLGPPVSETIRETLSITSGESATKKRSENNALGKDAKAASVAKLRRYSKLLPVLFALVVCIALFLWIWNTVRYERTYFPDEVAVNQENAQYGQICLYLDEFNLDNKTVHIYVHFDAGPKLQEFPNEALDARPDLGNITIITIRPTPVYVLVPRTVDIHNPLIQNAQRWVLDPSSPYNYIEVDVRLAGSESAFPFDSYSQTFWLPTALPGNVTVGKTSFVQLDDLATVPFQFRILNNVRGYRIMQEAVQNNILDVRIERPWQPVALVMLVWCIIALLSVIVFLRTIRKKGVIEALPLLVGIAAVMIAVPTARIALVPSDIHSWTVFDMLLILPLGLSLITLLYAAYSTLYWRFDFDMSLPIIEQRPVKDIDSAVIEQESQISVVESPEQKQRGVKPKWSFNPLSMGVTFFGFSQALLALEETTKNAEIMGWILLGLSFLMLPALLYGPLKDWIKRVLRPTLLSVWFIGYMVVFMVGWILNLSGRQGLELDVMLGLGFVWIAIVMAAVFSRITSKWGLLVPFAFLVGAIIQLAHSDLVSGSVLIALVIFFLLVYKGIIKITYSFEP